MPTESGQNNWSAYCKRLVKKRLVKVLFAVAFLWFFLALAGFLLRRVTVHQISELTNSIVTAENIKFKFNASVSVRDLSIIPYGHSGYDNTVLKAKKVYARFSIMSMLKLKPVLKKLYVSDFVFDAQYDVDNEKWNFSKITLDARKNRSAPPPVIRLKGGTLKYSRVTDGTIDAVAALPLDAEFKPSRDVKGAFSFNLITAERDDFGRSQLQGSYKPGVIKISGGISSADIPGFERIWNIGDMDARLEYDKQNYFLTTLIRDMKFTHTHKPETLAVDKASFLKQIRAFNALQKFFTRFEPVGLVDIDLNVSGDLKAPETSKVAGKLYCKDVKIRDNKFPYTIENLRGPIDFSDREVSIKNLQGRHKDVQLEFTGWLKDFGPELQYEININSDNCIFDADLYEALGQKAKKAWSLLSPRESGVFAIDYQKSRGPKNKKKTLLKLGLKGINASYKYFVYPLNNIYGTVIIDDQQIKIIDAVSRYDGKEIMVNGEINTYKNGIPDYNVVVNTSDIPLDQTLIGALPEENRTFFENKAIDSNFIIEKFTGRIWSCPTQTGPLYNFVLENDRVKLNEQFTAMLPDSSRDFISRSNVQGDVSLKINLIKKEAEKDIDYQLTIGCLGNSICLKEFPYPLRDIRGSIVISKDKIILKDMNAVSADNIAVSPDSSRILINGLIKSIDNEFSSADFEINARDFFLDQRLGIALDKKGLSLYKELSPRGTIDFNSIRVKVFKAGDGEKYIDFTGAIRLKDSAFDISHPITQINADMELEGLYKTTGGFYKCLGVLRAESFKIRGKRINDLRCGIDYQIEQKDKCSLNDISAGFYGGILTGKIELEKQNHEKPMITLQCGFSGVDLQKFLADGKKTDPAGQDSTTGTMQGSFGMRLYSDSTLGKEGGLRIQINNMQIGKVSPLSNFLRVLKLTKPTDYTFEQMVVDSHLKNNHVFIDNFDLSGESVAFKGSGKMDLKNDNIELNLIARGKRLVHAEPSVLQSFTEGLGKAFVQMDVKGNIYDPEIKVSTLPVIKNTFGILGTKNKKKH